MGKKKERKKEGRTLKFNLPADNSSLTWHVELGTDQCRYWSTTLGAESRGHVVESWNWNTGLISLAPCCFSRLPFKSRIQNSQPPTKFAPPLTAPITDRC